MTGGGSAGRPPDGPGPPADHRSTARHVAWASAHLLASQHTGTTVKIHRGQPLAPVRLDQWFLKLSPFVELFPLCGTPKDSALVHAAEGNRCQCTFRGISVLVHFSPY